MESEFEPIVELWADDSAETDNVREELRSLGVPFRETQISDPELPALNVDGVLYSSRTDVDFALNALVKQYRITDR